MKIEENKKKNIDSFPKLGERKPLTGFSSERQKALRMDSISTHGSMGALLLGHLARGYYTTLPCPGASPGERPKGGAGFCNLNLGRSENKKVLAILPIKVILAAGVPAAPLVTKIGKIRHSLTRLPTA